MLTRDGIEKLLASLNSKLKSRGLRGEICIFGGAAMILNFNSRESTKDVDAVFAPKSEFNECIEEVAQDFNLDPNWLNDGVKGFLVSQFDTVEFFNFGNLKVYTPTPEYLLAMKAMSSRFDSMDGDDLRYLIKHLGITNIEQVLVIIEKYYPRNQVQAKTQFFLEEVLENM